MSSKAVSKCLGLLYAIVNTFWRWPLACEQPQILRLRARPTRKRSGSESLCGRFAQDDILKFMNHPDEGPHYPHTRDGLTLVLRMDNLLALELCRPFLQEGARAFVLVLGGAAYGEQRGLEKKTIGQRQVEAAIHRLHGVLDGQRRV